MWLPKDDRKPLDENTDLRTISTYLKRTASGTSLPNDALVLDQDLPTTPVIQELRDKKLQYRSGRPGLHKYNRVEVIHASHIFTTTTDKQLLNWCEHNGFHLITCNVRDFKTLDNSQHHHGIIAVTDQGIAHHTPPKLAQKVNQIFANHTKSDFKNKLFAIK